MIFRIAVGSNAKAFRSASRLFSESKSPSTASPKVNADVPGLSEACIHPSSQPVGPGVDPKKSGAYKVPEYFCYNNMSYFEAEIEMAKYRLPQPSALKTHPSS